MVNAPNRTEEDISPKTSVHHHANTRSSVKQGLCQILNVYVCACILSDLEARGGCQRNNTNLLIACCYFPNPKSREFEPEVKQNG